MAGSFDPITLGHMYLIQEGARLFNSLTVAIGSNPDKKSFLSLNKRIQILKQCTQQWPNVTVAEFENKFLVDFATELGASHILKGIRNTLDYEQERLMRNINEDIAPNLTTVFLMPPRPLAELSSSFVRGLIGLERWQEVVKPLVPVPAFKALVQRLKNPNA